MTESTNGKNNKTTYLFTDGSVNPQENIGFGAYLVLNENEFSSNTFEQKVQIKKFDNTSSTKLELESLLWALKKIELFGNELIVYTDCQNILGLPGRRERFEKNDYFTKKNKRINNYLLYQEFYKITDTLNCTFVKVKGHKSKSLKDDIDKLFTLVDKGSRNALREYNSLKK